MSNKNIVINPVYFFNALNLLRLEKKGWLSNETEIVLTGNLRIVYIAIKEALNNKQHKRSER